jgi:hypothetical protein
VADLFGVLARRLESNVGNAIDTFVREMPEYRTASTGKLRTSMLDFGRFARQCALERAAEGQELSEGDLTMIRVAGQQRGEHRLSLASQRHALTLHTTLMVREIHEAAAATDIDDLFRLVSWIGQQGPRARDAYLEGYLQAVGRSWSPCTRIGVLARTLLADEPVVPEVGDGAEAYLADRYLVTVARFPDPSTLTGEVRQRIVESLLQHWRIPMDWADPGEFVALTPVPRPAATDASTAIDGGLVSDAVRDDALRLVRAVAEAAGRPCAVGASTGHTGSLSKPHAVARRISQVTPPERTPRDLRVLADAFVELAVAGDSQVDDWLRTVAERLKTGPDLIRTLDAYYRHDMARAEAAAAVRIHPRTLDYRLRRVRDLTGLDPASTRGVRIFTTAISRLRAGRGR